MIREDLVIVCCTDIAGQVRGKGFPTVDLGRRRNRGIGWVPTNAAITAFGVIPDSPFGSIGDLLVVPDERTEVRVDFRDGSPAEHFFLGDIRHTDGKPWDCCLRHLLAQALETLTAETGLTLQSTFEHEFHFIDETGWSGSSFSQDGFRIEQAFGETLTAALRAAGVEPDSFLREYGPGQYEVTTGPQAGVTGADHAIVLRILTRATAFRLGRRVSFTPLRSPGGVGNGVHIHMSFLDAEGRPVTHDPKGVGGLAKVPASFVAGALKYLPSYVALTAPSIVSYARLTPHRWSAAFNNLGFRDREAAIRICPVAEVPGQDPERQFNVEFRAADAAASPHLQLAAVVLAGLQGIREGLPAPTPTHDDLTLLNGRALAARGLVRLPQSLPLALERFAGDKLVRSWFPDALVDLYVRAKRGEIAALKDLSEDAVCRAYEQVY
ncbi:MAG: glutamine synthetase [Alphaproteobacteria bacterium]|nr:glutamine synthetase [Alphaproteobacteria bacterium]